MWGLHSYHLSSVPRSAWFVLWWRHLLTFPKNASATFLYTYLSLRVGHFGNELKKEKPIKVLVKGGWYRERGGGGGWGVVWLVYRSPLRKYYSTIFLYLTRRRDGRIRPSLCGPLNSLTWQIGIMTIQSPDMWIVDILYCIQWPWLYNAHIVGFLTDSWTKKKQGGLLSFFPKIMKI